MLTISEARRILNIPKETELNETIIKNAFRLQSRLYHPDSIKCQCDKQDAGIYIAQIKEAQDVLINSLYETREGTYIKPEIRLMQKVLSEINWINVIERIIISVSNTNGETN